jgi:AraC-like DNA-binding protein
MPSPTRSDFRFPHTGQAWLRALGHHRAARAMPAGLQAHVHRGAWELCWLQRGRLDWWMAGEDCPVRPGEVVVTRPGEDHGARHAVLEPCDLWWIQFEDPHPDQPDALRALLATLGRAPRRFPGTAGLGAAWDALLRELSTPDAWSRHAALGQMHVLCALLGRSAEGRSAAPAPSPAIARCMAWAGERRTWTIPVAAMAHAAGLSPARLHARFRSEVGASPAEWLRARRLAEARRLLAGTRLPVGAIARRLGYASQQQFAHVFTRSTGVPPRTWRAGRMAHE